MIKRIITLLLSFIILFSLITPAYAKTIYVLDDRANAVNTATHSHLLQKNEKLSSELDRVLLRLVTLESWDGDFLDEELVSAQGGMHIRSAEKNYGMVVVFDIEQGNYGIQVGYKIRDIFNEATVNKYLNKYFCKYYNNGNYNLAVTSLFNALCDWYLKNNIVETIPSMGVYELLLYGTYIFLGIIALIILSNILYGVFAKIAYIKHNFDDYYSKRKGKKPKFRFWYAWNKPHLNPDALNIWNFTYELWHDEPATPEPEVQWERNGYDIAANIFRVILFALIRLVFFFFATLPIGGGNSSLGGSGGGRSSSYSSSGTGGGGRSGGGGGGRR